MRMVAGENLITDLNDQLMPLLVEPLIGMVCVGGGFPHLSFSESQVVIPVQCHLCRSLHYDCGLLTELAISCSCDRICHLASPICPDAESLVMALCRAHFSSEHAVADRGIEQHERE